MSAQVLSCFWRLASIDAGIREEATLTLVKALRESEQKFHTNHESEKKGNSIGKELQENSEDFIDRNFSPDLIYSLKRLVRGLPSSREGARQGFATAMTEVLRMILDDGKAIPVAFILKWLESCTDVSKSAKSSVERDLCFGYLFGIMALRRSGILETKCTTTKDLDVIIEKLMKISGRKFYFREVVLVMLIDMLDTLKHCQGSEIVEQHLLTSLKEEMYTPEMLILAIHLEETFPKFPWSEILAKSGLRPNLINSKNLDKIATIMKETVQAHPRVHSAWQHLMAYVPKRIPVKLFWDVLIEALLFDDSASSEKKYLGMQLFERILLIVKASEVEVLFTPNFIRCLMIGLSNNRQDLYKCSMHLIRSLPTICQNRRELVLPLAIQLLKLQTEPHFGTLMKTNFLGSLATLMDSESAQEIRKFLESIFHCSIGDDDTNSSTTVEVAKRRQWIMDHLLRLAKSLNSIDHRECILEIIRFFAIHAFFNTTTTSNEKSRDSHKEPELNLSESTKLVCQQRFYSAIATLSVNKGQKDIVYDNSNLVSILELVQGLETNVNIRFSHEPDEDYENFKSTLRQDLAEIRNYRSRTLDPACSVTSNMCQKIKDETLRLSGLECLMLHTGLLYYSEANEAHALLNDLHVCLGKMLHESVSVKRRDEVNHGKDSKTGDPASIDVIIDILLSFLARPSVFLREVAEHVFRIFCSQLSESALELLVERLLAKKHHEDDADESSSMSDQDSMDIVNSETVDVKNGYEVDSDDDSEDPLNHKDSNAPSNNAMKHNDPSDEESEGDLDDEQMAAFDEQVCAIFRERKLTALQEQESERLEINFKLRILELFDIFIKQQSGNKLILNLFVPFAQLLLDSVKDAKVKEIFQKSMNIMRNRLTKLREWPILSSSDIPSLYTIASKIASLAKESPSNQICGLLGEILATLVKIGVLSGEACEHFVSQIYGPLVEQFMMKKNSKIHGCIFSQLVKRYPQYSWSLIIDLLSKSSNHDVVNAFRQAEAYSLSMLLLRTVSQKSESGSLFLKHVPRLLSNITQTLELAANNDNAIKGLCLNRIRHIFKAAHLLILKMLLFHSAEDIRTLWNPNVLMDIMRKIGEDSKFKSPSLVSMIDQTKKLLEAHESLKRKKTTDEPDVDQGSKSKKKAGFPKPFPSVSAIAT